jgi:hypothetical protein
MYRFGVPLLAIQRRSDHCILIVDIFYKIQIRQELLGGSEINIHHG